ncbi:retinaldehyde-binding protein 1-like [Sycon ciliatum]|uniref:retinaldehyde-binding protein 1-like n=1 Tax=Sycon ciliatum TaxID=27933 RepID=UPI0020AE6DA0|eukprot:scpid91322/ scgid9029/ Clavesin-1; Retinaldehyde-binding protein 1-like 1
MASAVDPRWISSGLCERSIEKVKVELNETPERREEGLAALREKIREYTVEHEDFTLRKDTDKFLIAFLRARKYDVERAMSLLLNYHLFRKKHADLIEDADLNSVRPILEHQVVCVFGDRDSEGRRMFMFRPGRIDQGSFKMKDALRTLIYVLDHVIEDEETQVNGFVFIQNFADMTMGKVLMFDRSRVSVVMELFQDAFPARFKGFHLVNQSSLFSIVWALVKPFMKQKLRERYHFHGADRESLFSKVAKRDVPHEVDGDRPAYDPQDVLSFLTSLQG